MMLDSKCVDVDYNGIVIFTYPGLLRHFDGAIRPGQNILKDFTETDLGDKVVDAGSVIPIINIDDGGYVVRFFDKAPEESSRRRVIFADEGYVLKVDGTLFVADAAVFWDWEEYLGWQQVAIAPGVYAAVVCGVNILDEAGRIESVGYDLILSPADNTHLRTAKIREDSRVMMAISNG